MDRRSRRALATGAGIALGVVGTLGASRVDAKKVALSMSCDHGPGEQKFQADVSGPESVVVGGTFTVHLDGVPSDEVTGFGLNHIRDMTTDYVLPAGGSYVEGSARVVPDTGTPNVRGGATLTVEGKRLRLVLPARIADGEFYTPPSVEVTLRADSAAGTTLALGFSRFRLTVNAVVVGDMRVTCEPKPRPFALPGTKVVAPE
jgi:hypothetical protein